MKTEKVRIFLIGDYYANTGPSNVNKYLINCSGVKIHFVKSRNKILRRVEQIWRIFFCDICVFSGMDSRATFVFKIIKLLGKKSVYLMHGCVSYENEVNKIGLSDNIINVELYILNHVNLVLCVSEKYMIWVLEQFPSLKGKIHFLNSGIDKNLYKNVRVINEITKNPNIKIMAAGGDRIQKNNFEVCKVIEKINLGREKKIFFNVFGRCYYDLNLNTVYPHSNYKGLISKEELYKEFRSSELFVLNSEVESFGLSVAEALVCGCNILVSKNAGICSLLTLEENDIIVNVHDIEEISRKIEYILEHPNNKRLLNTIDFDKYTWEKVSDRLYLICSYLKYGKDFTTIM